MTGIGQHRFGVLFGPGDLLRIFLAQRLGFGTQLLGFFELFLDRSNLAVDPAGQLLVNLGAEKGEQEQDQHRDRDDLEGRKPPQFGLDVDRCAAIAILDQGLGSFGGEHFGRSGYGISHESSPP